MFSSMLSKLTFVRVVMSKHTFDLIGYGYYNLIEDMLPLALNLMIFNVLP